MDFKDGRTVKGVNFVDLKDAGDPIELAKQYAQQGADELVFLDITATTEKRKTLIKLVERIAKHINIPFTVGGGISCVDDVGQLLQAGADKVSINSAAVKRPKLIKEVANKYGSQCLVLAVDTKFLDGVYKVYIHGGRTETDLNTISWIQEAEKLGTGEILLTSMNNDGTRNGFALDITNQVSQSVNIPIIASGGAGTKEHFRDLFEQTEATGGLAASVFHYQDIPISKLKTYLKTNNIPIR